MESKNLHVQDQTILISDDEEKDTSYNEDNDSVIIISDDDIGHVSLSNYNLDSNSTSVSDSDSESDYIRITNKPGPKSRTRLKRTSQNGSSKNRNKKIRTCNDDGNKHNTELINLKELIECDTDISSEDDLFLNANTRSDQNILKASVGNKISLEKLTENEGVINNKLVTRPSMGNISLKDDLINNTIDHANKNDSGLHDSDKSISLNELIKCDTDILDESGSNTNNIYNNKIISKVPEENKGSLEKLIKKEDVIDNESIPQVPLCDISLEEDLDKNCDNHESDKIISLIKQDIDISDENRSNANKNVHNNKIIPETPIMIKLPSEESIENMYKINDKVILQKPLDDISHEEVVDKNTI